MSDLILHARVRWVRPILERTLLVPGAYSLAKLHKVLQAVFGWNDCHLHDFRIGSRYYVMESDEEAYDLDNPSFPETSLRLRDLPAKFQRFYYRYDFGDDWQVRLEVTERRPEQARRPEVLSGSGASPGECGGPADVRHRTFDLEKVRRSLARRFPPPRQPRQAPIRPAQPPPLAATGYPPLEGYKLEALSVRQQMMAALRASPEPLDLAQLQRELERVGTPLPHGLQTLKKAWRRQLPIRGRLDGRLELDPDCPEWFSSRCDLERARLDARSPDPPPQLDPAAPLPLDEVETALAKAGRFPAQLSLKGRLILALDAHGGEAPLSRMLEWLKAHRGYSDQPVSGRTWETAALQELRECVRLDPLHPDTLRTRTIFRKWAVPYLRPAHDPEAARERRFQERVAHWRQFMARRRCLVRVANPTCGAVMDLATGQVRVFHGQTGRLAEALENAEVIVGLDPRRTAEALDVPLGGRTFVDLSPPGDLSPVHELVDQTLGGQRLLGGNDLESDLEVLRDYFVYGRQHGYVLGVSSYGYVPIGCSWNFGAEPRLSEVLAWAAAREERVEIVTRGKRSGGFNVQVADRDEVIGTWSSSRKSEGFALAEILRVQWEGGLKALGEHLRLYVSELLW